MPASETEMPAIDFGSAIEDTDRTYPEPLEDAKDVMRRVAVQNDENRINAATNLLNTWNYAVQVQSNRAKWQPSDYKAFAIALVALDSVGKTPTETNDILKAYQVHMPVNQT